MFWFSLNKQGKTKILIILAGIFLIALVSALPNIDFVNPTPPDFTNQSSDSVEINITTTATGDSYTFVDLDESLVFWFSMSSTTSTNIQDERDTSIFVTRQAGAITNSTGHFTNATWFDGLNDYAVGTDSFIDELDRDAVIGNTALSAWIYPTGANTFNGFQGVIAIMGLGEQNPQVTILGNQSGDGFRCDSSILGNQGSVATDFVAVPLNQWTHIACSFEISGNVYNATLYINGVEADKDTKTITGTSEPYSYQFASDRVHVGVQKRGAFARWFKGGIDDAMFFNRSLSAGEMLSLYNSTAYPYYNNFTNLPDGVHTFKGYITDSTGAWNMTTNRTVTVDNTPPILTIDKSVDTINIATDDDINITWSATDTLSGADSTIFNVTFPNGTLIYSSVSSSGSVILNAPLNASVQGVYNINIWANDSLGNQNSTSSTFEVINTADMSNPDIEFGDPTPSDGSITNSPTINISVEDASDTYSFLNLDDSVILWMRMDDIDSGQPYDLSSSSNNGTKVGNTYFDMGYWGNSSHFDGNGDYIQLDDAFGFDPDGQYTWSFWINPAATSAKKGIMGDGCGGFGNGFCITLNEEGNNEISFGGGEQGEYVVSTTSLPNNEWTYVTITLDGTYGSQVWQGNASIYINGELEASSTAFTLSTSALDSFRIGYSQYSGARYMNGSLDDVVIFSRVLNPDEIKALYSGDSNPYYTTIEGLSDGDYSIVGHAVDRAANKNQTEERTFSVDTLPPSIDFVSPTPNNGTGHNGDYIYLNLSTQDSHEHYSFVEFENDLLLWMRMDDLNSSGDPTDISGNGNNGSLIGGSIVGGRWGNAVEIGSSTSEVSIPDSSYVDLHKNSSISIWAKADSGVEYYDAILMKAVNGNWDTGYGIWYQDTSTVCFWFGSYGESAADCAEGLTATDWTHYVMSVNDTHVSFYVNGVLEQVDTASYIDSGSTPLHIGNGVPTNVGYNSEGTQIDELIILNRTLTQAEVLSLYNATANQYERNFTLQNESADYSFEGFAVDVVGNKNQTGLWTLISDPCACPGSGNNFAVDMSLMCNFQTSCNLGTGNWTWVNSGYAVCNATLSGNTIERPATGQRIWIESSCHLRGDWA